MYFQTIIQATKEACQAIMAVYRLPFQADYKADGSPVTQADHAANNIIARHLKSTGIPVISEESQLTDLSIRKSWQQVWMVDPLDGTKEFVTRNGEFTVNIALIDGGQPMMGLIAAPLSGKAWLGVKGKGVCHFEDICNEEEMATFDPERSFQHSSRPMQNKGLMPKVLRMAVSRSHPDPQTEQLIATIRSSHPKIDLIKRGSSLKFCELSDGQADIYVRFGPTKEWDTAAGQAILEASGGEVVDLQSRLPLSYNKEDMLNPGFIAFSHGMSSKRFFSEFPV